MLFFSAYSFVASLSITRFVTNLFWVSYLDVQRLVSTREISPCFLPWTVVKFIVANIKMSAGHLLDFRLGCGTKYLDIHNVVIIKIRY